MSYSAHTNGAAHDGSRPADEEAAALRREYSAHISATCSEALRHLDGKYRKTYCAVHELDGREHGPSCDIRIDAKGRPKAICRSKHCPKIEKVLRKLGMIPKPRIVASFHYEYEDREHAFTINKFFPKAFFPENADGKTGEGCMDGVRLVPFMLPEMLEASHDLWVIQNEGEAGSLTAQRLGYIGTNSPFGAGKFKAEYAVHYTGKLVAIIVDNDEAGRAHANSVARAILPITAAVKLIYLPGIPEGGDLRDWVAAGGTAEQLQALIDAAPLVTAADVEDAPLATSDNPYEATAQGFFYTRETANGPVRSQLSNFIAAVINDVRRDDGVETTRSFDIELEVGGRKAQASVEAAEFGSLNWAADKFGSTPNIFAGTGNRDRVRDAIQRRSQAKERRVYTHTGWTKVGELWVYLHAGGAIGAGNVEVEVELPSALAHFNLPTASRDELIDGVRRHLQLLELGPVMIPLGGAIWRSVLGPCDFSLHLAGRTGGFKSERTALAWQHFGREFSARNMVAWSSTVNFLEALAFAAKDALLPIDEFVGSSTSLTEKSRMYSAAERLFRAQGNSSGRGRMRADTSLRPIKPPRGTIVSNGEEVPAGQSLRARMLILEISEDDKIDLNILTECQHDGAAGAYVAAMAGYLAWIAPQYEAMRETLSEKVTEYRAKAATELGASHPRTPGIVADLYAGWEFFLNFAAKAGAIGQSELSDYAARVWGGLIESAAAQPQLQESQEPAHRFVQLITSALAAGKAQIAVSQTDHPPRLGVERWAWCGHDGLLIGWAEDRDSIYLDPESAYKVAQDMAPRESMLPAETLRRRLKDRGLLASTDEVRGKIPIRKVIGGMRRSVLHFRSSTFGCDDASEIKADKF
jgi:hypothetical protein